MHQWTLQIGFNQNRSTSWNRDIMQAKNERGIRPTKEEDLIIYVNEGTNKTIILYVSRLAKDSIYS